MAPAHPSAANIITGAQQQHRRHQQLAEVAALFIRLGFMRRFFDS
jgi:hypothetical protein